MPKKKNVTEASSKEDNKKKKTEEVISNVLAAAAKKPQVEDGDAAPPPPVKTFKINLTVSELTHLRDLFNVSLPPDLEQSVSQALAASENRVYAETKLWQKIASLCKEARVPLESEAPDFVISVSGPPTLSVFQIENQSDHGEAPHNCGDDGECVFCDENSDQETQDEEEESSDDCE